MPIVKVLMYGGRSQQQKDDLARAIIDMTGSDSDIEHIPYDVAYEQGFEDMERRVPDTSKLEALTGWRPERDLERILDDVISFERARAAR